MHHPYHLEDLFNTADLDIKDGKLEAAVEKLEQILAEEPTFGKAYNHLGWLNETKFKNFNEAEKYYKLALQYAPEYGAAYKNYAILLSTLKKYDTLKEVLEQALHVPGMDKATVYNEYGIMYEQLEEYETAIAYYRDAAKATINDKTMEAALNSIKRCNTKMSL
ncbi:tetratricopeptide repeat protein [Maribacter sp. 2307ULW6-5]|uniref:tetratricopeptide repeat protein n=1 Tax=Maribacter sp. 2307ULW6-5 TaxID=3386275 RepID=UPI0039BCA1FE